VAGGLNGGFLVGITWFPLAPVEDQADVERRAADGEEMYPLRNLDLDLERDLPNSLPKPTYSRGVTTQALRGVAVERRQNMTAAEAMRCCATIPAWIHADQWTEAQRLRLVAIGLACRQCM